MASAAGTLKRLTLELGGNDAAIVLDDVDPKEVAPKIFAAAMHNSGQVCLAIKRLYVHDGENAAKVGDRVRIVETRPLSKLKRWRLSEVLERAR